MLEDDLEPQKQPKKPRDLSNMSISELEDYIAAMKEEIVRVEDDIKKKKAHQDAAASVFK